jgi:hypothetical protein
MSVLATIRNRFARSAAPVLALAGLLSAGAAQAANTWGSCTPVEVMSFSNRVHVRCSTTFATGILYVAIPTSNSAEAQRALTIAQSALVAGRPVVFWYESTATGASIGCGTSDCRVMNAIGAR